MEIMHGESNYVPTVLRAVARNLSGTGRGRKQALSIAVDATMVVVSLWIAYALRFATTDIDVKHLALQFLLLPPLTILIFTGLGIYRWIVRSSTIGLFLQIIKGAIASATTLLVLLFLIPPDGASPRSIFVIYCLVIGSLCCGLRLIWKAVFNSDSSGAPVAIYGAGSAGIQLASLLANRSEIRPVCFIDDGKSVVGTTIMGKSVLSGADDALYAKLVRLEVTQIIIAIPSLDSARYSEIYDKLDRLGIPFKTSPSFVELVSGQASMSEIREVSVNDILGRNEVLPDKMLLSQAVKHKNILITGGGGSIGSELCRQIMRLNPDSVTVLDNSEANLYHIGEEINQLQASDEIFEQIQFETILCSVTDSSRIHTIFASKNFDTVYHAAAYKHVPIVERFPGQGVEVNVFGTLNMVQASIDFNVGRFILISTDKAVRPTNAMGATKRVAELVLQAKARQPSNTTIAMVRFGNVLASNGSVVPKFRKQIASGGPVTLTDPDITRYFMTIPEASQLVIQASAISRKGDVFVLDMGDPIKISHLAETMVKLHCQRVEQAGGTRPNIAIKVTGLRPGEKMYEELFIDDNCEKTSVAKVMSANEQFLDWHQLERELVELTATLPSEDAALIKQKLLDIVFHVDQSSDHELKNIHDQKESSLDTALAAVVQ